VQRQFDIRALSSNRDEIERAVIEVQDYVTALLKARRAAPAGDLISDLLAARDPEEGAGGAGGRLSAAECVQLVVNLLAGGIDTTSAQLAHAIRLFAGHPAQWALLAGDPGLAPRAVDEVLRFEPVTPFTARICLEQVEHRGVIFPAGTNLARAELEEALAFLAPRTPGLTLDGPPQLGGIEGIYGIDKLPIKWSGSAKGSPGYGPGPDVT